MVYPFFAQRNCIIFTVQIFFLFNAKKSPELMIIHEKTFEKSFFFSVNKKVPPPSPPAPLHPDYGRPKTSPPLKEFFAPENTEKNIPPFKKDRAYMYMADIRDVRLVA